MLTYFFPYKIHLLAATIYPKHSPWLPGTICPKKSDIPVGIRSKDPSIRRWAVGLYESQYNKKRPKAVWGYMKYGKGEGRGFIVKNFILAKKKAAFILIQGRQESLQRKSECDNLSEAFS